MKHVLIYTDGGCRGNPGLGGWGALLRYGNHEKKIWGAEENTTNNRMELMAAIQALKGLRERCNVDLHTDSQYVQKGITLWMSAWKKKAWKKADNKPVKNADLWQELDKQAEKHHITWHWVRGHSDHVENDIAEALANQAMDEFKK